MPTTRAQAQEKHHEETIGDKREIEEELDELEQEPAVKKTKTATGAKAKKTRGVKKHEYITGVIERGYVYFFFRPRINVERADTVDDVQDMHILLVPRPPESESSADTETPLGDIDNDDNEEEYLDGDEEMNDASDTTRIGADAVPAPATTNEKKKKFRLLKVGKRHIPPPESAQTKKGRRETFYAKVASVGHDLKKLEEEFSEKNFKTKTRGTKHQEPARLAARGPYVLVNNNAKTPSKRATHFGYTISHPKELGDAHHALGVRKAAVWAVQLKNPLAPVTEPAEQAVHNSTTKLPNIPQRIIREIFGEKTEKGGQEDYGLKFASCEAPGLLDYEGAELLFVAGGVGEEVMEERLGEGRGEALEEKADEDSSIKPDDVLKELDMDPSKFPTEGLEGIFM